MDPVRWEEGVGWGGYTVVDAHIKPATMAPDQGDVCSELGEPLVLVPGCAN